MNFDSGEVLPGLEQNWTFLGANLMEWSSGLIVFLMISLFGESPVRVMPLMILGCILTAYSCLLYTSPSPRDATLSRMPSSA